MKKSKQAEVFDSELQWFETVAEFPGKVSEYILYQSAENTVQLKRAKESESTTK